MSAILLATLLAFIAQASAECCTAGQESDFCTVFNMLSPVEQSEVVSYLGEGCSGDVEEALKKMEKRKPNFMRYGRSGLQFGKKGSDPNFLRFGRSQPNFLRFGKSAGDPNFLRFGRGDPNILRFGLKFIPSAFPNSAPFWLRRGRSDPNFLRFGKSAADPNFLRFGKRSADPNFLRFGRSDNFDRESRKPNFLRFGK